MSGQFQSQIKLSNEFLLPWSWSRDDMPLPDIILITSLSLAYTITGSHWSISDSPNPDPIEGPEQLL
jgi:hypothetical protein